MTIRSDKYPNQDSVDGQFRIEGRKAKFREALLFVLGIVLGGVLGYLGMFDSLGSIIKGLLR